MGFTVVDHQELSINVGDRAHLETEPIVVSVYVPPLGKSLIITLAFDDDYHLPYIAHCDSDSLILQGLPDYYRRNVYVLTVNKEEPT
jgi:hypothetical protein